MASLAAKKKKPVEHSIKRKKKEEEERGGGGATLDELKALGHQLLCSRAHINNLPVLLSYLSPSSPLELALECLISLQSFFTPLVLEIPPSSSSYLTSGLKTVQETETEKDPESVYKAWLRAKFDEFVNSLIDAAVSPQSSEALRDVALDAIMEFVKQGRDGKFQSAVYHRFLHRVVYATSSAKPLLDLIAPKYFNYLDVRYFTYTSMDKIAKTFNLMELDGDGRVNLDNDPELRKSRMEVVVRNIHDILSCISPLELLDKEPSHEMWSQSEAGKVSSKVLVGHGKPKQAANTNDEVISAGRIAKKLKLKFTKAWLSFLKLPLPLDVYKKVLPALHQNVIPFMANPAVLCDFLTKSYDIGGVISVMALSGLFILMTQHGLEYPNFYEKLFALLRPAVFMAKHRAVFFQLLDTCLRSAYLPAYLAAAFTKKLSRLSLSVPPSGELVIIAIIHNLLRRHPSINFLVHQQLHDETDRDGPPGADEPREDESESVTGPIVHSKKRGIDPFNNEESDPVKSNAMIPASKLLLITDSILEKEARYGKLILSAITTVHWSPGSLSFVSSLENDLTVRAKTSEVTIADFSSASYASIFKSEMRRRVKQVPLAFYKVAPTTLFWESDFPGWTFGGLHNGKQQTGVQKNDVTNEGENGDYGPAKRQRLEGS